MLARGPVARTNIQASSRMGLSLALHNRGGGEARVAALLPEYATPGATAITPYIPPGVPEGAPTLNEIKKLVRMRQHQVRDYGGRRPRNNDHAGPACTGGPATEPMTKNRQDHTRPAQIDGPSTCQATVPFFSP